MDLKLHIIHDSRRQEKYEPLISELKRQGITDYEIYPCILSKTVVESISESHKMIVREAKERGDEMVCLAEDDLMFPAKDGWRYFLKNIPMLFDIYLSGSYLIDNRITYISPTTDVDAYVGNHLIIIHSRYYDTFLATDSREHIDTAQTGKGFFKLCYPMAALQRPGFSANNLADVNYNGILKPEDVYGEIYQLP